MSVEVGAVVCAPKSYSTQTDSDRLKINEHLIDRHLLSKKGCKYDDTSFGYYEGKDVVSARELSWERLYRLNSLFGASMYEFQLSWILHCHL